MNHSLYEQYVRAACLLAQARHALWCRERPRERVIAEMLSNDQAYAGGMMTREEAERIYARQESEAQRLGATAETARERIAHWEGEVTRLYSAALHPATPASTASP